MIEDYFKVGTERFEKHLETLDYTPKVMYSLRSKECSSS